MASSNNYAVHKTAQLRQEGIEFSKTARGKENLEYARRESPRMRECVENAKVKRNAEANTNTQSR